MKTIKMVAATFEDKEEGTLSELEQLLALAVTQGAPRNAKIGIAASELPEVLPTISVRWEVEPASGMAAYQALGRPNTAPASSGILIGFESDDPEFLAKNPHLEPHKHETINDTQTCEICRRKPQQQ